ncbi:MAG: hypothetical protein JWR63_1217 [Conexibacter sp.]|nr:hypothetical protein [Conexibacter sp.]
MDDLRQAWDRDGYVALRGAAPTDAPSAYAEQIADARAGLLVRAPGDDQVSLATQAPEHAGAVDPYALSDAARALLLAEPLTAFLTGVFGDDAPLLFDATEATGGAPDDGPYRDATFVALTAEPETLVTLAVAIGDGAAVTVFPGSQRIATTPFSGRYRHFNPERDGDAALQRHRDELATHLADAASDTITLEPGDIVVWTADLVHRPPTGPALIAHLCPARVQPGWFAYRPERARHAAHDAGRAWIATQYYDLVDAVTAELAPTPVSDAEDEAELTRVEDAMREHDQDLATEPQPGTQDPASPAAPRRGGGLVDSVRGMLNRRGRGR